MKVLESHIKELILGSYTSKLGTYYFFEDFVISEINEHALFNWEEAEEILEIAKEFYGDISGKSYISNRVNPYSVVPTDWLKFFKKNLWFSRYAIVTYTPKTWTNALMEKMFVRMSMRRFKDLEEAIDWVSDLNKDDTDTFTLNKSHFL